MAVPTRRHGELGLLAIKPSPYVVPAAYGARFPNVRNASRGGLALPCLDAVPPLKNALRRIRRNGIVILSRFAKSASLSGRAADTGTAAAPAIDASSAASLTVGRNRIHSNRSPRGWSHSEVVSSYSRISSLLKCSTSI